MKTQHQYDLGVPLAKPRVALSAASPRSFLAVGFPLQSLTRNAVLSIFIMILGALSASAQFTVVGNCNYPDSMALNKVYEFSTSNDTLIQELKIFRVNEDQVNYSILTRVKDTQIMAGELVERHEGIADWRGCYGAVTDDNVMHIDNWDYKTKDGLLIISVYGGELDYVTFELATLINTEMRKK